MSNVSQIFLNKHKRQISILSLDRRKIAVALFTVKKIVLSFYEFSGNCKSN
jgi:hypothetical protein